MSEMSRIFLMSDKNQGEILGFTTKSPIDILSVKHSHELIEQDLKRRMKNRRKRQRSAANKLEAKRSTEIKEKKFSPLPLTEKKPTMPKPKPSDENPTKNNLKPTKGVPKGKNTNPTSTINVKTSVSKKMNVGKPSEIKTSHISHDPINVGENKGTCPLKTKKTNTNSSGMSKGCKVHGRGGKIVNDRQDLPSLPVKSENIQGSKNPSDRRLPTKKSIRFPQRNVVESSSDKVQMTLPHDSSKTTKNSVSLKQESEHIVREGPKEHILERSPKLQTSNSLRGFSGRGIGRGRVRGTNFSRNSQGVQILSTSKLCEDTEIIHYPKLTIKALSKYDKAHEIWFQFRCAACDIWFWKKKHPLKAVAKHSETPMTSCRCEIKWDKLKKRECWGKGHFSCITVGCGHVWTNDNSAFIFKQPCYKCGEKQFPISLTPPPGEIVERGKRVVKIEKGRRKTRNTHACEACEWGTIRPCKWWEVRTGPQKSDRHLSTGSTISSRASVINAQIEYLTLMDHDIYSDAE